MSFAGIDGFASALRSRLEQFRTALRFAWKVRGSEKSVVRGGFGIAFAHPFDHGVPNANSLGFEKSAGPARRITASPHPSCCAMACRAQPERRCADPWFWRRRSGQKRHDQCQLLRDQSSHRLFPAIQPGIQRELARNIVLEIGYVGNLSRKLASAAMNINQIAPNFINAIRPAGRLPPGIPSRIRSSTTSRFRTRPSASPIIMPVFEAEKRFSRRTSISAPPTRGQRTSPTSTTPADSWATRSSSPTTTTAGPIRVPRRWISTIASPGVRVRTAVRQGQEVGAIGRPGARRRRLVAGRNQRTANRRGLHSHDADQYH